MLAAACWGHLDALKQWKEQSGKQKGLVFEKNIGYFAASGVAWKSSNMHTGTNCLGMNGLVLLQLMGSSKSAEILTRAWM